MCVRLCRKRVCVRGVHACRARARVCELVAAAATTPTLLRGQFCGCPQNCPQGIDGPGG